MCSGGNAFEGFDRLLEREANRALTCQVVNLIQRDFGEGLKCAPKVGENHRFHSDLFANSQREEIAKVRDLSIAGGPDDTVAPPEEKSCQVSAVLS